MAVMPTCAVEITRTGSSISRSAARAPAEPASARGASAPRRAVTTVYSPITKKALADDQRQHGDDAQQIRHRLTRYDARRVAARQCAAAQASAARAHRRGAQYAM